MADLAPLRGWRYDVSQVGELSEVVAPPYDVIQQDDQNSLYDRHPYNVIRLILNRSEPEDAGDERYRRAADFWKHWRLDGILRQEHEESYYVYHQTYVVNGKSFTRRAMVGRLRLEAFGTGRVFPHEETLSGPKEDRFKLMRACGANLSPIFGLYPDETCAIQQELDDHVLSLTAAEAVDGDGVRHQMWCVTDPSLINRIREQLSQLPVYIADGHHRYETALRYREELRANGQLASDVAAPNFVLAALVPLHDPGLVILPTHRLISGLAGLSQAALLAALQDRYDVEFSGTGPEAARETWELIEADGSQSVLGFGLAADQFWCCVRLKAGAASAEQAPGKSTAWRSLGVSILHCDLLPQLSGTTVPSVRYVHEASEVFETIAAGGADLGCLVPACSVDDVCEIAGGGETMPPKSTYFYPKLLSGLVFHSLR